MLTDNMTKATPITTAQHECELLTSSRINLRIRIAQEIESFDDIALKLTRVEEIAVARFHASNVRGAVLSMRKYYSRAKEYECQRWLVSTLQRLERDLLSGVFNAAQFEEELQRILEFRDYENDMEEYSFPSDDDLLHDLANGNLIQVHRTAVSDVKVHRIANPAA
jgi:hypothetical protein